MFGMNEIVYFLLGMTAYTFMCIFYGPKAWNTIRPFLYRLLFGKDEVLRVFWYAQRARYRRIANNRKITSRS